MFFADINGEYFSLDKDVLQLTTAGDGRPDYLVKNSKGQIDAYLNIGKPNTLDGIQWIGAGHIAAGFGTDDISIADINGDGSYCSFSCLFPGQKSYRLGLADSDIPPGRADYLIWGGQGSLGRTPELSHGERRPTWLGEYWSYGFYCSRAGQVIRLLPFGRSQWRCKMFFPKHTSPLTTLQGKVDYVLLGDDGSADVYLNKGEADASVIGDGVRLASLNGNGLDSYVWLAPNAAVTLYNNGGYSADGQNWIWYPANGGNEIANGAGAKREQIIFADMDGDGKDDFNIVDPKSGAITLYLNGGAQIGGGWGWVPVGSIASGIGGPGSAVRLADMDGKHCLSLYHMSMN